MPANVDDSLVKSFQPLDENMKVWRYIDPLRLLVLLQTRSLYFTRADVFEDPFEGSLPKGNHLANKEQLIRHVLADARTDAPEEFSGRIATASALVNSVQDVTRRMRQCVYISCWHAGEAESLAMWKLYGMTNGSVAIQSTYKKLLDALPSSVILPQENDDEDSWTSDIFMAMVQYKDYGGAINYPSRGKILTPFIFKRQELEHEREVRAFAAFPAALTIDLAGGERFLDLFPLPQVLPVEIEIEQLVETIRVQPATPSWARESIEKLILKYGWDAKLIASEIDAVPLY